MLTHFLMRGQIGLCGLMFLVCGSAGAQQAADPTFKPTIAKPTYAANGPTVVIDEAHSNFHTAGMRYKPFADLLRSDGYVVASGTKKFSKESLAEVKILVIANAGIPERGAAPASAFTDAECDAVRDWVRDGGSLLLIADHAPFGAAAANLSQRFGVEMGKGWVFDRGETEDSLTAQLVFSSQNKLLGDHPIIRGRDGTEVVKKIRSFTGQSLSIPAGAAVLMKLSETARECATQAQLSEIAKAINGDSDHRAVVKENSTSVAGRAQGIALPFGKGKLVVLGEAAMLSAQVATVADGKTKREVKVGMNVPGYDNQQFAINLLHWLSGAVK